MDLRKATHFRFVTHESMTNRIQKAYVAIVLGVRGQGQKQLYVRCLNGIRSWSWSYSGLAQEKLR